VVTVLLILVGVYLAIQIAVAYLFVYPFRTPVFISPSFLGCEQEAVEFVDPKSKHLIRGWWVPHESPKVVIIAAHGYMMNRAELAPIAPRLKPLGIAFLFFDFPAHGRSSGRKSGFGFRERTTVRAAVEIARERYPSAKIVLMGSSMGSAASAFAIGETPELADALILDSAYNRLSQAVDGWWRFIGGKAMQRFMAPVVYFGVPIAGLNPLNIFVADALRNVHKPTLLLHGDRDTLAPPEAAQQNYDALPGQKVLVWFPGRQHSEARWEDSERYFEVVTTFLQAHVLNEQIADSSGL
jgi:uncharacterized protein